MFTDECEVIWSYSGNNLADIYLGEPDDYISGPIEVAISKELDRLLTEHVDNY
jgi:hypothetical protein